MKAVIQRVCSASVEVDSETVGSIDNGLLVYVGVAVDDAVKDAEFIARKVSGLRIFEDESGRMNKSVHDVGGSILLVSNFTLQGDCRKGRRPGFDLAADPEKAKLLYAKVEELIRDQSIQVETGTFKAHMHVSSLNDGPVTLIIDSREAVK